MLGSIWWHFTIMANLKTSFCPQWTSWVPLVASNLRCAVIITWIIWLTLVIYKCICLLNKGYRCTFIYIQNSKLLMFMTALRSVLYTDCIGVRNINTLLIFHRGQCSWMSSSLSETLFYMRSSGFWWDHIIIVWVSWTKVLQTLSS